MKHLYFYTVNDIKKVLFLPSYSQHNILGIGCISAGNQWQPRIEAKLMKIGTKIKLSELTLMSGMQTVIGYKMM